MWNFRGGRSILQQRLRSPYKASHIARGWGKLLIPSTGVESCFCFLDFCVTNCDLLENFPMGLRSSKTEVSCHNYRPLPNYWPTFSHVMLRYAHGIDTIRYRLRWITTRNCDSFCHQWSTTSKSRKITNLLSKAGFKTDIPTLMYEKRACMAIGWIPRSLIDPAWLPSLIKL